MIRLIAIVGVAVMLAGGLPRWLASALPIWAFAALAAVAVLGGPRMTRYVLRRTSRTIRASRVVARLRPTSG